MLVPDFHFNECKYNLMFDPMTRGLLRWKSHNNASKCAHIREDQRGSTAVAGDKPPRPDSQKLSRGLLASPLGRASDTETAPHAWPNIGFDRIHLAGSRETPTKQHQHSRLRLGSKKCLTSWGLVQEELRAFVLA
jgi:hypothetical protein